MAIVESVGSLEAAFLALHHIKNKTDPDLEGLTEFTVMLKRIFGHSLSASLNATSGSLKATMTGIPRLSSCRMN